MEDFSENAIRENCPHCDPVSQAFASKLDETKDFWIVCDAHPLCEGHILAIPKGHISCIGAYSASLRFEFSKIYERVCRFLLREYASVVVFEHGIWGQTVFHSHVHFLPFAGTIADIVPEGNDNLKALNNFSDLGRVFEKDGGYLYVSVRDAMWLVDRILVTPRFFRNRFAQALGSPQRADWKAMHINQSMMDIAKTENERVRQKWVKG